MHENRMRVLLVTPHTGQQLHLLSLTPETGQQSDGCHMATTDTSISPLLSKNSPIDGGLKRLAPKTAASISSLLKPSNLLSVTTPQAAPSNTDPFLSQQNLLPPPLSS